MIYKKGMLVEVINKDSSVYGKVFTVRGKCNCGASWCSIIEMEENASFCFTDIRPHTISNPEDWL